jgi:hypothetical protein
MREKINRRQFIRIAAAGGALYAGSGMLTFAANPRSSPLISPGCRGTKVKVARIYMATSHGLWPKPNLDLAQEVRFYESEFAKLKDQLYDVDFVVDELVTSPAQITALKDRLAKVDGILAIHFNIGVAPILNEILSVRKPTVLFAVPYSGHGWTAFGSLMRQEIGAKLDCMLTSDYAQLAAALRPFRAIHHLREAKILNVTTRDFSPYAQSMKEKFGTEIKRIELQQVIDAYKAVPDTEAKAETKRWIDAAEKVVEPSRAEVLASCRLALAFEKLLDAENATVMTVDCYGTMWDRTIKLPAYPCVGFTRLNDMGLGGICESDLRCAMTHIILQGLSGRPGFISDPTMDESDNSIILAHCLGTTKMDGPNGKADPYKLRTVMERREGVVPQVKMRIGQRVTQALLVGTDSLLYFTGRIIDAPVSLDDDRGCRTKITVKVDGDATTLWKNWSNGLHRQTCYEDITDDLKRFCRFTDIKLVDEAAPVTA